MQISYGTNPEIAFFPLNWCKGEEYRVWKHDQQTIHSHRDKKKLLSIYLYH